MARDDDKRERYPEDVGPRFERQERDLVLAPNEQAYILDETKGHIVTYVGPTKASLGNTDKPVLFDKASKKFLPCSLDQAIQTFVIAPEGWYVILKNPAPGAGESAHPRTGTANSSADLQTGHKVNMPGPRGFPLWPGQMAEVVQGHHLRSNQYLIVQVYDEESAKENLGAAVVKTVVKNEGEEGGNAKKKEEKPMAKDVVKRSDIRMGQLMVIKGTEVSFYIPPTGIRVVKDRNEKFVRDAISLETLEFCILLGEDGNKRYLYGPDVVFPEPTEIFIEKITADGKPHVKFRATELNPNMGIYVKVIADYEEDGIKYGRGDELFITGVTTKIYYPRPEHAIIKYGEEDHHFSVAIPPGEARYVLDKDTGKITLERGPLMYLPDPRHFVIVRRVLSDKEVNLWFPGNKEAMEYNKSLEMLTPDGGDEMFVTEREFKRQLSAYTTLKGKDAVNAGDEVMRRKSYTPPRTVTLDIKYDGAVTIQPWTGYAVLVTSKTGKREVIVGPKTYLLEYDEILEAMELSSGKPKTTDKTIKTVYLRVLHNKVSDIIYAETKDLVDVTIKISYRVNFEGEPERWFNVENYVKFMTDHMRSLIKNVVKRHGIEDFYSSSIDILRDAILGIKEVEGQERTGKIFPENGMRIYDAEILDVTIGNDEIEEMLIEAQQESVSAAIGIAQKRRTLEVTKEEQNIYRSISDEKQLTALHSSEQAIEKLTANLEVDLKEIDNEIALGNAKLEDVIQTERRQIFADKEKQVDLTAIQAEELTRRKEDIELKLGEAGKKLELLIREKVAEVDAVVKKTEAMGPDVIAALQAFGDKELAGKLAECFNILSILDKKSVAEIFKQVLGGTPLESAIENLGKKIIKN